ncbi:hypothetical protein BC833DRAFT_23383 [Globomyces pollinis-pini]|nr:hypothetical protein BC833DRAFT_23383 [Globomyces pollinis-pini]
MNKLITSHALFAILSPTDLIYLHVLFRNVSRPPAQLGVVSNDVNANNYLSASNSFESFNVWCLSEQKPTIHYGVQRP